MDKSRKTKRALTIQSLPSQEQNAQTPRAGPSLKFSLTGGREAGFHRKAAGWIRTQPVPWLPPPRVGAQWRSLRHPAPSTRAPGNGGRVSVTSARPGALPAARDKRQRVSRTAPGGLPEERGSQLGQGGRRPREAWGPRRGGGGRKEPRAVRACARPRHVGPEELPAGPARRGAVHSGLCESEIFLCLGVKKRKKP